METLYIVVCRGTKGPWMPAPEGVLTELRLAENYIELKKLTGTSLEYAIVTGPITNPVEMAAQELLMATF